MNRLRRPIKPGVPTNRVGGGRKYSTGMILKAENGEGLSFIGADVNPRRDYAPLKQNNRVARFFFHRPDFYIQLWYPLPNRCKNTIDVFFFFQLQPGVTFEQEYITDPFGIRVILLNV